MAASSARLASRVFRAQIDVAVRRARRRGRRWSCPRSGTKGSPSISMRSEKVPESPSSALQTMYFCSAWSAEHRLPFDAGREGRAAAAAQARVRSPRSTIARRRQRERGVQSAVARRARGSRRALTRIGDADAREGQPLLVLEIRDLLGRALTQRVHGGRSPASLAASNRLAASCACDRPVGDAAGRRCRPRPAARARAGRASRCAPARCRCPRRRGLARRWPRAVCVGAHRARRPHRAER